MKAIPSLSIVCCLAACAPRQVDVSEYRGRWTWEGTDCGTAHLEIEERQITYKDFAGERGALFRIRADATSNRWNEHIFSLQTVPHASMPRWMRERVARGEADYAILLKLDGEEITPLIIVGRAGTRVLRPEDYQYGLFHVRRCA